VRALVFRGPWDMAVEERPEPSPAPDESLLEIIATGICGSDLHGYTGDTGRRHPGQVMGHETVARVLDDRTGRFAAGALVTVNPVLGCGRCAECAAGQAQRCPERRVIGVQPELSAAFAERMVAPSRNVVPLPDGTPADLGALVEPLAVGFHAVQRGGLTPDDELLVIGGGPIGQAVALAARRLGAASLVVSEPDAHRRELLGRLGFTAVDPEALGERRPTLVVDAVGSSRTLATALEVSAPGARIVLVGMASPAVELAAYAVSTGERSIIGTFSYDDDAFAGTAAWVGAHAAAVAPLVEAHVGLAQAPDTFRALARGELTASKVLVHPQETT
jgi:threonine dehydrogenase-like Zn-dependent dehydrogenase